MSRPVDAVFVTKQLLDLDVPEGSLAWQAVFEDAVEAAGVLNRRAVAQYIEQKLELLPNYYFEVKS